MSEGRLIGVVGPSGVGKDSVMAALAEARPGFHIVRRVITRAPGPGEQFETVNEEEFVARKAAGVFALDWRAHGLAYGIPCAELTALEAGQSCLVNLSRAVLREAEERFENFVTLHLTAPPEVLAARLAGRGRETPEEIRERLLRSGFALPGGLSKVIEVANDRPIEATVEAVLSALHSEKV